MREAVPGDRHPTPPWSPEGAREVADAFLDSEGLREPDVELLRFYQNAIFRLPRSGLTLRVYGPEDARAKAVLMASIARFLEDRDFPSVRLAPRTSGQPFEVLGRQVSLWRWIDEDAGKPRDFRAFGALLRRLHAIAGKPGFSVPRFDPMAKIVGRLARLKGRLPAGHLDVLEGAAARVAGEAESVTGADARTVLLHGDALIANTIPAGGHLVLIDFDSVGVGVREWDLAPTRVTAQRFRRSQRIWRDFLDGYGADGISMARIEAAGKVKQLSMTVALCFNRGLSAAIDAELDLRIGCWAGWDFETEWHSPSLRPAAASPQTVENGREA
jgi:Ser/Thr protein kinase RdoA (MazF antagonist)